MTLVVRKRDQPFLLNPRRRTGGGGAGRRPAGTGKGILLEDSEKNFLFQEDGSHLLQE